jgi:hypothetical protein
MSANLSLSLPCSIYFPEDSWSPRFGPDHFTASIHLVDTQSGIAMYHILIKFGNEKKIVEKRYSQFVQLSKRLRQQRLCTSIQLPPKTCSPHGSISGEFLERRRAALELYLLAVFGDENGSKEAIAWLCE